MTSVTDGQEKALPKDDKDAFQDHGGGLRDAAARMQAAMVPSDVELQSVRLYEKMLSASVLDWLKLLRFTPTDWDVCLAILILYLMPNSFWWDLIAGLFYTLGVSMLFFVKRLSRDSLDGVTSRWWHQAVQAITKFDVRLYQHVATKMMIWLVVSTMRTCINLFLHPLHFLTPNMALSTSVVALLVAGFLHKPFETGEIIGRSIAALLAWGRVSFFKTLNAYSRLRQMLLGVRDRKVSSSESTAAPTYQYTPLQPGEIRLLRLCRKQPLGAIRAQMIVARLEAAPPFDAISYTWADNGEQRKIFIGSARLATTVSAWHALRDRASFWRPVTVWIDQVCINQSDDDEKGRQVSIMFDIYHAARRVIAHLGCPSLASTAVAALSELMWLEGNQPDPVQIGSFLTSSSLVGYYPAIFQLIRHPWFTRVWIVQEVAAARVMLVSYGGRLINWDDMVLAIMTLRRPGLVLPLTGNGAAEDVMALLGQAFELSSIALRVQEIRAGGALVEMMSFTPLHSLPSLLARTRSFLATDPRDKIYALQSLALATKQLDGGDFILPFDYSINVKELYIRFAQRVLTQFPDPYYVMNCAGLCVSSKMGLPSWAPDWTSIDHPHPFNDRSDTRDVSLLVELSNHFNPEAWAGLDKEDSEPTLSKVKWHYRASRRSAAVRAMWDEERPKLAVCGLLVGAVSAVTTAKHPVATEEMATYVDKNGSRCYPTRTKKVAAWLEEAAAIVRTTLAYLDEDARTEVFWRTLIGDVWDDQKPAPATEASDAYQAWRRIQSRYEGFAERLDRGEEVILPTDVEYTEVLAKQNQWMRAFGLCGAQRALCGVQGMLGVVPYGTQTGDVVVIAPGANVPWVLRPFNPDPLLLDDLAKCYTDHYQFVGECYVHGVMDGELFTEEMVQRARTVARFFSGPDVESLLDDTLDEHLKARQDPGVHEDELETSPTNHNDGHDGGGVAAVEEEIDAHVDGCEWFMIW